VAIDTYSIDADGRRVVFGAHEFRQGTDLNGDGDINDVVVHVYDAANGRVTNVGVAMATGNVNLYARLMLSGSDVIFLASESGDREDYDGNGQIGGYVLHRYNALSGALTNYGVPAASAWQSGTRVAVASEEARTGTDMNDDGDMLDDVMAIVDLDSGAVTSLKVAVDRLNAVVANGQAVAFYVSESVHGPADLNGDGDSTDLILHSYQHALESLINHGLPGSLVLNPQDPRAGLTGPVAPFRASETWHGADLNGDGDTTDHVIVGLDTRDQRLVTSSAGATFRTTTSWLPEFVDEFSDFHDVNGDGDYGDTVVRFRNVVDGSIWNTMLAVRPALLPDPPHAFDATTISISEIDEASSKHTDFNGDGDALDTLIARFDPTTHTTTVFPIQSNCHFYDDNSPVLLSPRLVGCQRESVGGIDRTGDGDLADYVAVGFNFNTGRSYLGRSALSTVDRPWLLGKLAYALVDELSQGQDLNGDSDRSDTMIHRFDVDTGMTAATAPAVHINNLGTAAWAAGSTEVFFGRSEDGDRKDYNGDGDILDVVLHVVR